ncbi:hypothetical protein Pcinc_003949 [Petrolisthes cinctipes]|uniref:Uncharacterized protein n=1 Tax=Petrolisthes cinctipes TaxID=88211 RepID=A0AAE1GFE5_PETCI|nr:hypothetical protein Pcinc_003949 [Petrolisthes cinctipes]
MRATQATRNTVLYILVPDDTPSTACWRSLDIPKCRWSLSVCVVQFPFEGPLSHQHVAPTSTFGGPVVPPTRGPRLNFRGSSCPTNTWPPSQLSGVQLSHQHVAPTSTFGGPVVPTSSGPSLHFTTHKANIRSCHVVVGNKLVSEYYQQLQTAPLPREGVEF